MIRTCDTFLCSMAFVMSTVLFGNALAMTYEKWTAETYPNPYLQPQNCSRMTQSYVCDPDEILKEGQADQLDNIIFRVRNETACLCEECPTLQGVTVAIALMESISNTSLGSTAVDGAEVFARELREKWSFGHCDDDVLLFVSSVDQQFVASVGSAVTATLGKNIAITIFQANMGHFTTGYYYQGLESIMESYYDVLRQHHSKPYNDQHNKPSSPHNKDIIVALVVSVTTLIALLIFVTIIIYRLRKTRQKTEEAAVRDSLTRWHTSKNKKSPNGDYERCSVDDHGEDDNSSEGSSVLSETDSEILSEMYQINRMYNISKRQLSAVPEESENEEEDEEEKVENSKRRTSSVKRKCSVNGVPHCQDSLEE